MVCEKTELICENTELLCENSKHFTKVEVSLLGFHRNYQNRQFMYDILPLKLHVSRSLFCFWICNIVAEETKKL